MQTPAKAVMCQGTAWHSEQYWFHDGSIPSQVGGDLLFWGLAPATDGGETLLDQLISSLYWADPPLGFPLRTMPSPAISMAKKKKPCTALLPTFLSRVWFRFQLGSSNSCLLISPSPDHWLRAVPSSNLFFPRHHSFPNRVSNWLFIIIISTSLCSISVPWPGIEPAYPAMEAQSPNHWTARAVPSQLFSKPTSMGTAPPQLGPCDGDHQALLIGRHTAGGRLREGLEHKLLPETSVPRKQEKRSYTYVSITLAPQKPRGGLQWFLPPSPYRK